MKKILALVVILVLSVGLLIYSLADPSRREIRTQGATPDMPEQTQSTPDTPQKSTQQPMEEKLRLFFYNDHPVLQLIYEQLADEFFNQTGIRVVTVSSEANLEGEEPVLFSVSDPGELSRWRCLDLSDTVAYGNLACECFTLTQGERVVAIASEAEPLGIIFNTALLARVGYTAVDLDSFADLKTVASYITENQNKLGFGAFAQPDSTGRYAAVLSAVPEDIRPLWDLYISNMASQDMLSGKAVFTLGTLSDMEWYSASGELQLEMLPLYTGAQDEQTQGLHCFGKHYWCIRAEADQEQIDGALAFLSFLVSPRVDGSVPVDDLALLAPYRQAVYARNSVHQRFRSDIAQGKKCTVYGAYESAEPDFIAALNTYMENPTDENWSEIQKLRK